LLFNNNFQFVIKNTVLWWTIRKNTFESPFCFYNVFIFLSKMCFL
jgi:hypothetical protein